MMEDEYIKFLDKNNFREEKIKLRYDEIAEDKCHQIEGIYPKWLANKCHVLKEIYDLFANRFILWKIILISIIPLFFAFFKPMSSENTIQNSAGNIFTAFISLLGLLAVFFVFKVQSQRGRTGDGIEKMCKLIKEFKEKFPGKEYSGYKDLKTKRGKYSTKELLICFSEDDYFLKIPSLINSWVYTINQLYINHINRDYFIRNLYLFTFIIIISLGLMIGLPFPEHFEIYVWKFSRIEWNTFWFSLDIVLVSFSIVYVFHTLMVMIMHVYPKRDLENIHKSERGIGGREDLKKELCNYLP